MNVPSIRRPDRHRPSIRSHVLGLVLAAIVLLTIPAAFGIRDEYRRAPDQAGEDAVALAEAVARDVSGSSGDVAEFVLPLDTEADARRICDLARQFSNSSYDGYELFYAALFAADGAVVCTTREGDAAESGPASVPWEEVLDVVDGAARAGQVVVPDPVTGEPAMYAVVRTARFTFVLANGPQVLRRDSVLEARDDAEIVVVDRSGHLVERLPAAPEEVAGQLASAAGFDVAAAERGAAADLTGVARVYGSAVTGQGWTVLVGIDRAGVFDEARSQALRSMQRLGGTVVLLVALALLLSQRIAHPLRKAARVLDRAAAGDRSARLPVAGPAEVALVAAEYNALADLRDSTESELRRQFGFISAVASSLGEGVYAVDLDGRVNFVNDAALALIGRRRSEVDGRLAHELLHAPDEDGCVLCEAPDGTRVEAHLRRVSGTTLPVSATAAPVLVDGRLVGHVVTFEDTTERRAYEAKLTHQALHDALTGLPNRTLFLDRLEQALERSHRDGTGVGVLFLDIDRFKVINDSLGHSAGDALLIELSRRLSAELRGTDTVARFGGDEFVVLADGIDGAAEATLVAERLMSSVSLPVATGDGEIVCSVSVGIALADGVARAEDLLRDADAAMYRAKERGRERYELFDDRMRQRVVERLEVETALRRALDVGELRLHYQPIVDADGGRIRAVEALVRWRHPQRGELPPNDFIPVAEESGLIVPLGDWVIREACRQAAAWLTVRPDDPVSVSVNLSPRQLATADLMNTVRDALRDTGLPPSLLALEVTESVLMDDVDFFLESLAALRSLGIRLSIDDFGTGYSSLNYLGRFPVHTVKIDGSFIKRICSSERDAAIVRSIVELSHALDLEVICEGVEGPDEAAAIAAHGTDLAQGYHYLPPAPPEIIGRLLDRRLPHEAHDRAGRSGAVPASHPEPAAALG